jgi:exoribonuclease-2
VIKGDLLRLDGLPLVTRLPGMPELPRGQRLELDLLGVDLVDLVLEARVHQVLAAQAAEEALGLDELPMEEPPELPAASDAAAAPPAG